MTPWKERRVPSVTAAEETRRVDSYWQWSSDNKTAIRSVKPAAPVCEAEDFQLVQLLNAADADWEASYMEHSIGYSWSHYSKFGNIYGLRGEDGLPVATLLVADGAIVHARERRNARLGHDAQYAMEALAEQMNWTITPDALPFEMWGSPMDRATRMTYLARNDDGRPGAFATIVLRGGMDHGDDDYLAEILGDRAVFLPDVTGIPTLAGFEGNTHEILSFGGTDADYDLNLSVRELADWMATRRAPGGP